MKIKSIPPFVLLIILSCQNEEVSQGPKISDAQITGTDDTFCQCCQGGYFVLIDNDQYRVSQDDLPEPFNNVLNIADAIFPIPVNINWKSKKDECLGNEILIKKISLRD